MRSIYIMKDEKGRYTMATKMKPYAELTEAGKKRRLAKYEKDNAAERQELQQAYEEKHGTSIELHDDLANLVRPATLKENANGSKTAVMRLAIYNPETKKPDYKTATVYIAPEKVGQKFEDFIAGLCKGDLLSIRYAVNDHGTLNIWNIFQRKRAAKEAE